MTALAPRATAQTCVGSPAQETLCLLNAERAAHGLHALHPSRALATAAQAYSDDMVARGFFAHVSPSGETIAKRISRTGWLRHRAGWMLGETLAWGTGQLATPTAIVAAWMRSPGHRAIVLRPRFRHVGIGIAEGTPFGRPGEGTTVTADFGAGHRRTR